MKNLTLPMMAGNLSAYATCLLAEFVEEINLQIGPRHPTQATHGLRAQRARVEAEIESRKSVTKNLTA